MKMNKFVKRGLIGLGMLACAFEVNAQEAVIDIASIFQEIQQLEAMSQQLSQMQNQLTQLKSTYNAATGSRNLGMILNNPTLNNSIPTTWTNNYKGIQQNGAAGLSASGKVIRNSNMIYNCQGKTGTDLTLCNRDLNKTAQDQAFTQDAYQVLQSRMQNIQSLMSQINSTQDPKAIAELQARITAEQASIGVERDKLNMYLASAHAERELIDQQKRETSMKDLTNPDHARDGSLSPVDFHF